MNGITVQPTTGEGSPITLEAGCYIDGHNGQYGPDRLAEIADGLLGTDHAATMARYRAEGDEGDVDAWEARRELTDEIVDALNSATSGGYWEWCDGEFYLSATCEECGGYIGEEFTPDGAETCECVAHAAYPHDPGTLYDCDACESACYCDDLGSQCVHCAIVEECSHAGTGEATCHECWHRMDWHRSCEIK